MHEEIFICFPDDGPVEAAKDLPCLDESRLPLVTFLGPKDKWKKGAKKWKHLYDIDCKTAYRALSIWVAAKNPFFADVQIIDTNEMRKKLECVADKVEQNIIMSDNPDVVGDQPTRD